MRVRALQVMILCAGLGLAAPALGAEAGPALLTLSRSETDWRPAATVSLQADGKTVVRDMAGRRSETTLDRCRALDFAAIGRAPIRPLVDYIDGPGPSGDQDITYRVTFAARIAHHPVQVTAISQDADSSVGQWSARTFADLALCLDGHPEAPKLAKPYQRATLVLLWSSSLAISRGQASLTNGVSLNADRQVVMRGIPPWTMSINPDRHPAPLHVLLARCPGFAGKLQDFKDRVRDDASLAFVPDLAPRTAPAPVIPEARRYRVAYEAVLGEGSGRIEIEAQDTGGPFVTWAASAIVAGDLCVALKGTKSPLEWPLRGVSGR